MATTTIPVGTTLYHGTNNPDFDEEADNLKGPVWLSSSRAVAEYFARRNLWADAKPRIIEYVVMEELVLECITSPAEMQELAEKHDLTLIGVEGMKESIEYSDLTGWVIPNNYPNGDDIMLSHPSSLDFVSSQPI